MYCRSGGFHASSFLRRAYPRTLLPRIIFLAVLVLYSLLPLAASWKCRGGESKHALTDVQIRMTFSTYKHLTICPVLCHSNTLLSLNYPHPSPLPPAGEGICRATTYPSFSNPFKQRHYATQASSALPEYPKHYSGQHCAFAGMTLRYSELN